MQELFRLPQKDAEVQLQGATAIVTQWHAAYMEVLALSPSHRSMLAEHGTPLPIIAHICPSGSRHPESECSSSLLSGWLWGCGRRTWLPELRCCGR